MESAPYDNYEEKTDTAETFAAIRLLEKNRRAHAAAKSNACRGIPAERRGLSFDGSCSHGCYLVVL